MNELFDFRNFLHGRIAATSLLGLVELERTLPHREVRIFVGTWNMNGQVCGRMLYVTWSIVLCKCICDLYLFNQHMYMKL